MRTRPARPDDAAAIAAIYNQGITERIATFETRPRRPEEILQWFDGRHPLVVAEAEGRVVAFASIDAAAAAGFWKLVSRVFVENRASRALLRSLGFRQVGIYQRHARLDGIWRDVVIVERWIADDAP
jgi:phosphinothricin acetyltransferase